MVNKLKIKLHSSEERVLLKDPKEIIWREYCLHLSLVYFFLFAAQSLEGAK